MEKWTDNKTTYYRIAFGSVGERIDYCANVPTEWQSKLYSRETNTPNWHGTENYSEALDLARYGWPDGRNRMSEILEDLKADHQAEIAETVYDVAGAYPNVPLYLGGSIDCMVDTITTEAPSKIIRVCVANNAAAGLDADQIIMRGALVLSYVDALENAGWRIELVTVEQSAGKDQHVSIETVIKPAHAQLDLDAAAFALAHPSWQRRLGFHIKETIGAIEENFAGYYGKVGRDRPANADMYFTAPTGKIEQDKENIQKEINSFLAR